MSLDLAEIRSQADLLLDALNRRDFDAIEQMEFFNDESRFHSTIAAAEGDTYQGVDGLRRWAENVDSTWDDFRIELAELHGLDDRRVLTVIHATGRAKASQVPLDVRTGGIWTWENGVWVDNESYASPREAFDAAGVQYRV